MSKGKLLFSTILFGLMGSVMLFGAAWLTFDTLRLGLYGKEAVATVQDYVPSKSGSRKTRRTYHYHIVFADGYRFKVELGSRVAPGTVIYIVYLPNNHDVVISGTSETKLTTFLERELGFRELAALILGVGFLWMSRGYYRDYKKGDRSPFDNSER